MTTEVKRYRQAVCKDGFSVSIQANETAYCNPRSNSGPYTSVELGYPNQYDPLIEPYAEDPENPTMTVYGWVPSEIVLEMLLKHGGWVDGELPPMIIAGDSIEPLGGNSEE